MCHNINEPFVETFEGNKMPVQVIKNLCHIKLVNIFHFEQILLLYIIFTLCVFIFDYELFNLCITFIFISDPK